MHAGGGARKETAGGGVPGYWAPEHVPFRQQDELMTKGKHHDNSLTFKTRDESITPIAPAPLVCDRWGDSALQLRHSFEFFIKTVYMERDAPLTANDVKRAQAPKDIPELHAPDFPRLPASCW